LHAARNRPENNRPPFSVFVDEFQNFASSEDFSLLFTEARKFNIAATVSNQDRYGQFGEY
jgi:hypothetical protein